MNCYVVDVLGYVKYLQYIFFFFGLLCFYNFKTKVVTPEITIKAIMVYWMLAFVIMGAIPTTTLEQQERLCEFERVQELKNLSKGD